MLHIANTIHYTEEIDKYSEEKLGASLALYHI